MTQRKPANLLKTPSVGVDGAFVYNADVVKLYEHWPAPTCIIADGPYGLGKFPGEPKTVAELPAWYAPHAAAWHRHASPDCTLWFWSSELAWATVHPILELHGWEYAEACTWDKGIQHIAGNVNSKTIRGMPVATEVAVRYTRKNRLLSGDNSLTLKEWVRAEWLRSGLPMNRSNEACGVKNAATRKYLTQCHLWYFPPGEAMEAMADYCTRHGVPTDVPYFSLDGQSQFQAGRWEKMRAKWNHVHGLTNVWSEPPVHGNSRLKVADGTGYLHANQKPLRLMELQVNASTDPGDVVWEPFGGMCSATLAAARMGRRGYAAEIYEPYFQAAGERLRIGLGKREKAA
ncbi:MULTISPECIES: DNA methyltransferase [Burkholderia]|uniref:Methyltransferase n=1 Tax=Burkholderia pyrrocinia TaxID=60550 RepID=A0A318IHW3_BURPY|nr:MULTISPECIES: DNA methyltransferase [Burkholderia]PXX32336.1 site-specific DNA-methyltransferase (adenine-specific) [Burkholderia pyrrocinia]SFW44985.1 site-specific DNA-methyltransferase (adenine-specific) [Burkholderia sp. NFACC33-1]SFX78320.1 site-specific DNA-methyltransferase (adenine-specific) [Burkholderia sp. NFPP32]